jgi:hypothetical protein
MYGEMEQSFDFQASNRLLKDYLFGWLLPRWRCGQEQLTDMKGSSNSTSFRISVKPA